MCGIVGVVLKPNTGLTKRIEDSFYQLLFVNTLRGDDSTGVIAVETDTTFHIMKEAVEAAWFVPQFQHGEVGKRLWVHGKALIGHNRKGTVGKIDDENAHPFVVDDDFAMVHNGTLIGHHRLADTKVDSEALAIVMARAFKEEDYKTSLETTMADVTGAYAVSIYDQRHNKVRLFRNKERPMAYVETSDAWFFASEGLMLHWILSRNGYTSKDVESMKVVPEHTVVTFDLTANTCTEEKITIKKYTPPQHVMALGGATHTKTLSKTTGAGAELSKSEYKRIRKSLMGTKIAWWVDDYVENSFPRTFEEGETVFNLMGTATEIDHVHTVHTSVEMDLKKFAHPLDMIEKLWSGTVIEMSYNTGTKSFSIYVSDAQPLPFSYKKTKKTPVVIDSVYIQRKLDEQEKALDTLH